MSQYAADKSPNHPQGPPKCPNIFHIQNTSKTRLSVSWAEVKFPITIKAHCTVSICHSQSPNQFHGPLHCSNMLNLQSQSPPRHSVVSQYATVNISYPSKPNVVSQYKAVKVPTPFKARNSFPICRSQSLNDQQGHLSVSICCIKKGLWSAKKNDKPQPEGPIICKVRRSVPNHLHLKFQSPTWLVAMSKYTAGEVPITRRPVIVSKYVAARVLITHNACRSIKIFCSQKSQSPATPVAMS